MTLECFGKGLNISCHLLSDINAIIGCFKMNLVYFIAFAFIFIYLLTAIKRLFGSMGLPYQRESHLFSAAERNFLTALDASVGPRFRVFGKVRVADLARVKSGLSNSRRQTALNWIAQKHVDFVVCKVEDLSVVCAVELNDKSHNNKSVTRRDKFLKSVCDEIGLPLVQTPAKRCYSITELRAEFQAAIQKM